MIHHCYAYMFCIPNKSDSEIRLPFGSNFAFYRIGKQQIQDLKSQPPNLAPSSKDQYYAILLDLHIPGDIVSQLQAVKKKLDTEISQLISRIQPRPLPAPPLASTGSIPKFFGGVPV